MSHEACWLVSDIFFNCWLLIFNVYIYTVTPRCLILFNHIVGRAISPNTNIVLGIKTELCVAQD